MKFWTLSNWVTGFLLRLSITVMRLSGRRGLIAATAANCCVGGQPGTGPPGARRCGGPRPGRGGPPAPARPGTARCPRPLPDSVHPAAVPCGPVTASAATRACPSRMTDPSPVGRVGPHGSAGPRAPGRRCCGGVSAHDVEDILLHAVGVRLVLHEFEPLGVLVGGAEQALARIQQQGQLREDAEPDLVIELLYGPVYHRWLLTGRVLDERRIAAVVGTVVTGLEPKPPAT
ncbi:hypothetical protein CRI70_19880 [Streptomyces sp. Ru87]|nr:hypothetical protein CRI70_19880 [Streptomyces sp. Ru87]